MRPRPTVLLVLSAALVVSVYVIVVSAGRGDRRIDRDLQGGSRELADHSNREAIQLSQQAHAIHLFQSPAETMPRRLRAHVKSIAGPELSEELRLSPSQYSPVGGGLWVVDGGGLTCLVEARSGSLICSGIGRVSQRGLALGVFAPPRRPANKPRDFEVFGLAPDWAATARLRIGISVRLVRVHRNVYFIHASRPITLLGLERRRSRRR